MFVPAAFHKKSAIICKVIFENAIVLTMYGRAVYHAWKWYFPNYFLKSKIRAFLNMIFYSVISRMYYYFYECKTIFDRGALIEDF
jgi:hypothetical protein